MRRTEPIVGALLALAVGCAAEKPAASPPGASDGRAADTRVADDFDEGVTVPSATEVRAPLPIVRPPVVTPTKPPVPAGDDPLVVQLLNGGGATLKKVLAAPATYRFQVLYGAVTEGTKPTLEARGFRVDDEYFFPASSMKVPIALALFDRFGALRAGGRSALTRDATLRIHAVDGPDDVYVTSVARETWRALIVSDNASANRLLGIVGHREAHETLWALGLASARIHTGFATGGDLDPAELSPRIEVNANGGATDELPARKSDLSLPPTDATGLAIGVASLVNGKRVEGPMAFGDKNAMRLRDLQTTLVRIVRPDLLPAKAPAGNATKDDVAYVKQALGTFPSESGLAGYDRNVVADYQLSPFLRGIERVKKRGHFQIFTKVGQAYGFLIANAYVVDEDTKRSFFLTAAIYANPGEVMNDDDYAYDSVSFPALADVAEVFCRHAFAP